MNVRSLMIVLALLLAAVAANAQDTICVPAPGTTTTTTTTTGAMLSPDVERFNLNAVSQCYGISSTTVADLRTRHDWGTIYFVSSIAQRTGRPVTEIASLAEQGMAFNQIAARYNLNLDDLTTTCPMTRVAGFQAEIGTPTMTMQPTWISDRYGNVILTDREARRLMRMGYTWEDIAVASNVSAQTGVPVYQVLQWIDRGLTWPQIARQYGLNTGDIMDISNYPFRPAGAPYPTTIETVPEPAGAGPTTTMPGTAPSMPSAAPGPTTPTY